MRGKCRCRPDESCRSTLHIHDGLRGCVDNIPIRQLGPAKLFPICIPIPLGSRMVGIYDVRERRGEHRNFRGAFALGWNDVEGYVFLSIACGQLECIDAGAGAFGHGPFENDRPVAVVQVIIV